MVWEIGGASLGAEHLKKKHLYPQRPECVLTSVNRELRQCPQLRASVPSSRTSTALSVTFLQADDGIRDLIVTGVQTCALPICHRAEHGHAPLGGRGGEVLQGGAHRH